MSPEYDAEFPEYNAYGVFPAAQNVIAVLRKDLAETRSLLAKAADGKGLYREDLHEELFYKSAYGAAALSHAAVGTLGPTIEAVLTQEFAFLGTFYDGCKDRIDINKDCERWTNYDESIRRFWNVRCVFRNGSWGTNIVEGLSQLTDALKLGPFFEDVCFERVRALFAYRNFALHNGYEADLITRKKFRDKIVSNGWEDLLAWGTTGGDPWLFSMTDDFMSECCGLGPGLHYAFDKIQVTWTDDGSTDAERRKAYEEFWRKNPDFFFRVGD